MKTKLLLISTIIIFSITNCQEKKVTNQTNGKMSEKVIAPSEIKKILIKQVNACASSEYWGDVYGKEDLNALVFIEDTILKNNGYKTPEQKIFNEKIKNIFDRIIDNNSQNQYLKIDTYEDSKCNKELNFYPYSTDAQYLYVDKEYSFITYFYALPQILDYQKIYPEVSKYEKKPSIINTADGDVELSRWKDLKDLPKERRFNQKLLVARNKYLFNDDKSQFSWLITNDSTFMRSLITDFGYTEDKKLLKWVFKNTRLPYFYKYAEEDILDNFSKLIWTKKCNGEIKVHQNTLDLIKELSYPDEKLYIRYVAEYLTNLDKNKNLNISQKAKIAAYLLCWGEQYKYDKRYDYNQMFMGHFHYFIDNGTYEKEFIKNNYYGLSKFKEWYEIAKKEKNIFYNYETYLEDSPQPLDYEYKAKPIR